MVAADVAAGHGPVIAELSRCWVERLSRRLTRAGRRVEGGWPGTLSDARRLLFDQLAEPTVSIPRSELEPVARAIYQRAKHRWLAVASRARRDAP